jgi:hypothetical protein
MRVQNMILIGLLGAGVYFLLRNLRERQAQAVATPTTPTAAFRSGGASNATTVPPSFFQPEHAGSDLYKAYGSVLPSGASRDLIR